MLILGTLITTLITINEITLLTKKVVIVLFFVKCIPAYFLSFLAIF